MDSSGYFLDETTKLYFGEVSRVQCATDINGFYPGENQAALDCIFARLPENPPPMPTIVPF
jgi:hypothetical protein